MEVDRRENPREPAAVEVSIYYNSLALLSCKIVDISPDGAFVQMGEETLPMHATVDLSLTVYAHGLSEYLRIPAEVIHIKREGAGLRLKHPDYQSFSRFVNLLNTLAITEAQDARQIAQA